jgi:hypothetical protein
MISKLTPVAVFALGGLLIGGCNKEPAVPTILPASINPYISDLPVPDKFKLAERQSEDQVKPGRRTIRHLYEGEASLQAAENFYQHYMPQANWELLERRLNKGVYSLKYRKGMELCEIRIEQTPKGLGTITQIRATIQSVMSEAPA